MDYEPKKMQVIGDLFIACKKKWNLAPKDVLRELGLSDKSQISSIAEAYLMIHEIMDKRNTQKW